MVSEKHHQRVTRHKEFLSPQNRRLTLWLIFFLAVLLRLLHFSLNSDNPLMYMPVLDEKYYVAFGHAVSGGALTGDNKEFFMDPLYGYLLAGIFFLCGDNLTTVRLIQIVVDALNIMLIYRVGRKVWKEDAAITAAFGYAVYPVAFFYSLLILKTTLCTTMLLLFTLCLIYALEKEKGRWCWYGLGMLAGIMTQLRGNLLLLMPLVILMIPVWHWGGWYTFAQKSLLLVLGFLVVLSVGGIRNYWVRGTFTLLSTQSGRLFYSCNNPQNLTGRYNVPDFARPDPVLSEMDFHEEAERRKGESLTPGSVSFFWMMETFRFLYHHPEAVFRLLFNKIKGTLGHCEIANNHSYYSAARFSLLLKWPVAPFRHCIFPGGTRTGAGDVEKPAGFGASGAIVLGVSDHPDFLHVLPFQNAGGALFHDRRWYYTEHSVGRVEAAEDRQNLPAGVSGSALRFFFLVGALSETLRNRRLPSGQSVLASKRF